MERLRAIHEKLRRGDFLSDEELKIARKHYRSVVNFFKAINDRRYDLSADSLQDYVRRMDVWDEARKVRKSFKES